MSQYTSGPTSGSLQENGPGEEAVTSYPSAPDTTDYTPDTTDYTPATDYTPDTTDYTPDTTDYTPDTTYDTSGSSTENVKDVAREKAGVVKDEAQDLAQTAKEEIGNVNATAAEQLRRLVDQSTSELSDQARTQQQRLTSNLRTLTDELETMANSGGQAGMAHDLVRQASQQSRALGDWLDGKDPAAVLDEVRRFARRKPGTFLAVAAGIGFLSGRLTRGLAADSSTTAGTTTGTMTGTMTGTSSLEATPAVGSVPTYPTTGSTLPLDDPAVVEPEYGTGYSDAPLDRGETR